MYTHTQTRTHARAKTKFTQSILFYTGSCYRFIYYHKFNHSINIDPLDPRNMSVLSVTLDMSKLSDWLKALASENMAYMLVTLDVSKLSGWLKAVAE